MKWITRERPKIDRIACPWLIARFIDPAAEFLYVPAADVLAIAKETGAIPTTSRAWNTAIAANCAALMPSWTNTISMTQRCVNSPSS